MINKKNIVKISLFAMAIILLTPVFALGIETDPPTLGMEEAIETITSIIFGALMAISVIVIIIAGFMFVTAGGNDDTVTKARTMLLYAVIGIVVAIIAGPLVNWIASVFGVI